MPSSSSIARLFQAKTSSFREQMIAREAQCTGSSRLGKTRRNNADRPLASTRIEKRRMSLLEKILLRIRINRFAAVFCLISICKSFSWDVLLTWWGTFVLKVWRVELVGIVLIATFVYVMISKVADMPSGDAGDAGDANRSFHWLFQKLEKLNDEKKIYIGFEAYSSAWWCCILCFSMVCISMIFVLPSHAPITFYPMCAALSLYYIVYVDAKTDILSGIFRKNLAAAFGFIVLEQGLPFLTGRQEDTIHLSAFLKGVIFLYPTGKDTKAMIHLLAVCVYALVRIASRANLSIELTLIIGVVVGMFNALHHWCVRIVAHSCKRLKEQSQTPKSSTPMVDGVSLFDNSVFYLHGFFSYGLVCDVSFMCETILFLLI